VQRARDCSPDAAACARHECGPAREIKHFLPTLSKHLRERIRCRPAYQARLEEFAVDPLYHTGKHLVPPASTSYQPRAGERKARFRASARATFTCSTRSRGSSQARRSPRRSHWQRSETASGRMITLASASRISSGGRLHHWGVKGGTDGQRNRGVSRLCPGKFARALDGFFRARDNDLSRSVVIRDYADAACAEASTAAASASETSIPSSALIAPTPGAQHAAWQAHAA